MQTGPRKVLLMLKIPSLRVRSISVSEHSTGSQNFWVRSQLRTPVKNGFRNFFFIYIEYSISIVASLTAMASKQKSTLA